MTTMHLGIEELIARQREDTTRHAVRHAWHLTEFWRRERHPHPPQMYAAPKTWAGELVELSITQLRWAMV